MPMLMSAESSSLLVIDVQDRLLRHVHGWQALLDNVIWLVRVAKRMGVPVMATEQYPKALAIPPRSWLRSFPRTPWPGRCISPVPPPSVCRVCKVTKGRRW